MNNFWKWLLITGLGTGTVFLLVAPIFKTGARHQISGADFVISHTVFGRRPGREYIPTEELSKPLSESEKQELRRLIA